MIDHDALIAAVTEACVLDPLYSGPNPLMRDRGFGLSPAARDRIAQALVDHTNASSLIGSLIPCGNGSAESFDFERVAAWLVGQAQRRPLLRIVEDLAHFLDYRALEGLKVEIIYGVELEEPINLGTSLRLERFEDLPQSWQKGLVNARRFAERHFVDRRYGDPVALTMRFAMSPGLASPGDQNLFEKQKAEDAKRQSLMDAIPPLLTLLGHGAPVASESWCQATGRGVPSLGPPGLATGVEDLGLMAHRPPIHIDPAEAQRLVKLFLKLPRGSQTRLIVPLRHLNRSRRQYTAEAAAIDLRTALEALLVPDAGQEITFKVSMFGAWMLANDYGGRERAFSRLKKAYALGSQAVHGGRFKGSKERDLIQEVQADAAIILKTMIAAGDKIDALEVALGKPLDGLS
jgi:Apea-like HEPN